MESGFHPFGNLFGYFRGKPFLDPLDRNWNMEYQQIRYVGLGHYQLRILGGYWSRRYFDFCYSAAFQTEMEDEYQPLCGSDDYICRNMRRHVPCISHGSCVGWLLGIATAERIWFTLGKL